jgi:hypothetical protein
MCRSGTKFDGSSTLVCPACNQTVHVGFGGKKNLAIHRTSKACQKKSLNKSKGSRKTSSKDQDLHTFFKPRVPLNPPTVTAPPRIHADLNPGDKADEISDEMSHETEHASEALCETTNPCDLACDDPGTAMEMGTKILTTEGTEMRKETGAPLPSLLKVGKSPCPRGIELLSRLEAATTQIPADIPLATPAHRLSGFSADPRTCVSSLVSSPEEDELEDDWVFLNAMLKDSFGWGESEMRDNAKLMLNRGEHGLDGFIRFFKYFVLERGLEGVMIETKVDALLHELDNR